jgi:D-alanine--poly(phosphoribitol) ligase subunit 1
MQLTNLLEYLEQTVSVPRFGDKTAFSDGTDSVSFSQFSHRAREIGTFLHRHGFYKEPVVVFMRRHPDALTAFFGALYAGCYYVPLDSEMPRPRIELIFQTLKPRAVICDATTFELGRELSCGQLWRFEELLGGGTDNAALFEIRRRALDTDAAYIVFTSGSTGVPKGVIACHRSVIDYIENLTSVLRADESFVFGCQVPLYFDACLKEVGSVIKFGATAYLIPRELFVQPVALVQYLNAHKINTLCWVVSALTLISGLNTFKAVTPEYLHTVAFGSEVFPIKQFNRWRAVLPNARFINLYGPTEATGMSCYYEVDREFAQDEVIPVGRPFRNTEILLLDDGGQPVPQGEAGEICIRGTCLTMGYYNDPVRTAEAFVQNPLNPHYPETIYKTGDLGRFNSRGELEFLSRKDYQIKHMGHRIELGEVEMNANMLDGVDGCCCVFDDARKKIVLCYVGALTPAELSAQLRERLPFYMAPGRVERLDALPLTPNGKIDRKALKAAYAV